MVAENVKNARSAKKEGEGKDLENVVEIASSEGRRYVCVDVCVVVSPQCVLLKVPPFSSRRAHPTSGEGAPQTHKKKRVVSKAFISTSESSEEEEAKVEVKKKEEEEEEEVEEVEEGKMVEGTASSDSSSSESEERCVCGMCVVWGGRGERERERGERGGGDSKQ